MDILPVNSAVSGSFTTDDVCEFINALLGAIQLVIISSVPTLEGIRFLLNKGFEQSTRQISIADTIEPE